MVIENLSGVKHEEKGLSLEKPILKHLKEYRDDTFIRMHYHSSFEINICDQIQGTINVGGKIFDLNRVKLIFLPPGTLHSYRLKSSVGKIKVWHLGLEFFPLINRDAVQELFLNISYQFSKDEVRTHKAEELLNEIDLSDNLRKCSILLNLFDIFYKTKQKKNVSRNNPFLHKIIKWSEANYHENITLDQGAAAVHLSRFHFSRKFKELTGSTYIEYLNNLRLENSLHFLGNGNSVSETAEKSGYSDVSYFIKKFRKMYDKTPLEYQKKTQKYQNT
jgi:AraC-like DNA-binding protein